MSRYLFCALFVAALCVSVLAFESPVEGCAAVMRKGESVLIASESALIVYDDKTKTEHFIRRGSFQTKVPYFGFLVPTPSEPELAEASDEIFASMEDWSKPEVITKTVKQRRDFLPTAKLTRSMVAGNAAPDAAVQVIGVKQVAGFTATILKASDAKKLREWLNEHDYDAPPSLERWFDLYVKAGWYLTAFQMKKPDPSKPSNLDSKAVRMSFQTDRPFYPYLEPENAREPGQFTPARLLRVYYVGTERVEGKLAHPDPSVKGEYPAWQGKAVWSNSLNEERRTHLVTKLSEKREGGNISAPDSLRLTIFEDRAAPRPGVGDLFFTSSADQSTLARPPIVQYNYVTVEFYEDPWVMGAVGVLALIAIGTLGMLVWKIRSAKVTP